MVYGLPRLLRSLAMTKGHKNSEFFFFFAFAFTTNDLQIALFCLQWRRGQRVMISFSFLWMNKIMVVCRLLRRFTPRNDKESKRQHPHTIIARVAFAIHGNFVILGSSLRGFEKAVAISVWQPPRPTHTVIARTEGSWQSHYSWLSKNKSLL